ncbi:RNA guanine-N7 methyltransferase activating subunit-like [Erpetoichthys calabaricus]|uniref:RNA guanine-7 methyltransferase activating subunit n=1 Tax=Erpetoichthys calabaricus TaxID=27687 RepID=A0A8C4XHD6_ERPCA|nr:RNA guanine-N7 methyltransferase activating subunit-like [Erpetoichthys calabaricus]
MSTTSESEPNYEEIFSDRFTSEDKEYQEYCQRPPDPPPVVEDWGNKAGGHQRGRDFRYRPYRGRDEGRSWSNDYRSHQHWQERGWGGGGQRSHQQTGNYNSSNYRHQGYHSYHQRPSSHHY